MGQLNYERFESGAVYVHVTKVKEVKLLTEWLIVNNNSCVSNSDIKIGNFVSAYGSVSNPTDKDLKYMVSGIRSIASVYALEGILGDKQSDLKVGELVKIIDAERFVGITGAYGVIEKLYNGEVMVKDPLNGYALTFKPESLRRVLTIDTCSGTRGGVIK